MALSRRIYSLGNRPGFKWQYIVQAQLLKAEGGPVRRYLSAEFAYAVAGDVQLLLHHALRVTLQQRRAEDRCVLHRAEARKRSSIPRPSRTLVTMGNGDGKDYNSPLASADAGRMTRVRTFCRR
jgi:hypothetical protein